MFEKAIRQKFRFESSRGQLTAEDLWDLPLSSVSKCSLDDVAKTLHRLLKNDDNVSFINPVQSTDETLQLKFDIVKHVISVRLLENEVAAKARTNRENRQKIMSIIEHKENEALSTKSVDELRALLQAD